MGDSFTFLPMPPRSSKPRNHGITMVIDTGLGLLHTKDQLQICSEYIDLWKLGWATSQLQPPEVTESKISILREHEISVCNGGTLLELAEFQGISSKLFSVLADVGADATEISSGSLEISSDRVCELISEAKSYRLRPYCEVGKKIPENDYEVSEYNERIKLFLEAGAEKVIIEARESGVGVGVMDSEGNVNEDDLSAIIDGIDIDSVIFEAPKKNQQVFFLKRFGPEANLGNIAPSDVISLETLRRGLRGDTIEDFYFVVGERHLHKHGWRD